MEAKPEETDPNKHDETVEDSETMEAEVVLPPRPTPSSPYKDILRKAGKTYQTARITTLNSRGIQNPRHGLSKGMRRGLRDPNWITAFEEDAIYGGRITTRYEDGQSSGVCPPPGDYCGSLALLFNHTLKLEKQVRLVSREIKERENNTTHVSWIAGRLETQLTQHQNTLMEMRGLLDTQIAARIQQNTHMMEVDLQAQANLIMVGASEEEIMAINGRLDAIGMQLVEITRALNTYQRFG
ncbi:unnamed protein product [Lactuca virosa]|uniref:Uncharacterized protein n=1 Tax=Lactuca virosa TaxID=75947 RepID=A0AAU9P1A8_9ASTR|nr:unnamed protein product [Lactuca virosa]